jgi:hypothetical protein
MWAAPTPWHSNYNDVSTVHIHHFHLCIGYRWVSSIPNQLFKSQRRLFDIHGADWDQIACKPIVLTNPVDDFASLRVGE